MDYIASLLPAYESIGLWGYWVIFLISFLESVVFLGAVVPGTLLILFAGFASAQGILDISDLIWFAAVGASLGDVVSFYLGNKGVRFFNVENKLLRTSKKFFKAHGGKSLLLGKFSGPLRSMVPFVAGLSHMPLKPFLFWNIASAFLWATSLLLLGYFFGSAIDSLEFWITRTGVFILALLFLAVVLWFIIKQSDVFFNHLKRLGVFIADKLAVSPAVQRFTSHHTLLFQFIARRLKRHAFTGLPLSMICLVLGLTWFTVFGLTTKVINSDTIVNFDITVAHFLNSYPSDGLTVFFFWITELGSGAVIILGTLVTAGILLLRYRQSYLLPLFVTLLGTELSVYLMKMFVQRDRFEFTTLNYTENIFSFPSEHAALAVALYGFIAYVLLRVTYNWRKRIIIIFWITLLILGIGLSQLYLKVHFLSDVLGGFMVGVLWLIVGIIIAELLNSSRKHPIEEL